MLPVLAFIAWVILIVITIKRIFERSDIETNTKLLWIILILLAPVLGMIIYYVFGETKRI